MKKTQLLRTSLMLKENSKIFIILTVTVLISWFSNSVSAETITIDSGDGIKITADTYIVSEDPETPVIVLYHQAGWSRGEYVEIAPKLNQLGFNCIAVDLRSGESVNDTPNLTAQHALEANKPIRYIDALPDILSSLHFINTQYPEAKIIAWGSSYSASLVLHVAGQYPELIDGALSFAPGEYFSKQGKSRNWIRNTAAEIIAPVFITSAKNEKNNWTSIYNAIKSENKSSFLPETEGNHGSRALWKKFLDSEQYWQAVKTFLESNFK